MTITHTDLERQRSPHSHEHRLPLVIQRHEKRDLVDLHRERDTAVSAEARRTRGVATRRHLVMEADVDEVPVLQARALQDGGEVAAEVISSHQVVLLVTAPAAETHTG